MDIVLSYVHSSVVIVIVALSIIGAIIKKTPNVPSWCIPYVLLVLGVIAAVAILGMNADAVIQGIIAAGVAVFGHELVKQGSRAVHDDNTGDE